MFQTWVLEKIRTHILRSVHFFETSDVYEMILKNMVEPDSQQATIWRRIACWIIKTTRPRPFTHTHTNIYTTHSHTHARTRPPPTHTHPHTHTRTHSPHPLPHTHPHTHTCTHSPHPLTHTQSHTHARTRPTHSHTHTPTHTHMHTHTNYNTYGFSTARMVSWTHFSVRLYSYVHCLHCSYFVYISYALRSFTLFNNGVYTSLSCRKKAINSAIRTGGGGGEKTSKGKNNFSLPMGGC